MSHIQYTCPVCGASFCEWEMLRVSIGVGKFEDRRPCLCPSCGSLERTRCIWLFFEKEDLLEKVSRFLHVAPAPGLMKRLREELCDRYVTIDLNRRGVDMRMDLTNIALSDNSFDFILCSNVLEHIEKDRKAMAEMFRVLTPGGTALIQVPCPRNTTYENPAITLPEERAKHFGMADHVRIYGDDIAERLADVGFSVESGWMPDILQLDPPVIERYNIAKKVRTFLCRKVEHLY